MRNYRTKTPSEAKAELLETVAHLKARHEAELAPYMLKLAKVEQAERLMAEAFSGETSESEAGTQASNNLHTPEPARAERGRSRATPVQSRLRIGDQRYRMLTAVRVAGSLSDAEVSARTGYGTRRVKEQLQADARLGVLNGDDDLYSLTQGGTLLLERFERNQRAKGKELPLVGKDQQSVADDPQPPSNGDTEG